MIRRAIYSREVFVMAHAEEIVHDGYFRYTPPSNYGNLPLMGLDYSVQLCVV